MAGGTVEDLELVKWCKAQGCLDMAEKAWLSVLAVPGKMVLRHPRVHDGMMFLAGHTFVGSCLQGLPLKAVELGGQTFWALEPMRQVFWLPIVGWEEWKCSTCSWLCPLAVLQKAKQWCHSHPLLLERSSEERNLLQTSAANAFWEIPKTGLLSIARATSIHVESGKSLAEVMLALVEGVLGPQSDAEKLRLLRLRLPKKTDLMDWMEDAAAEENLEPEDAKELHHMKQNISNQEGELRPMVRELAEKVRSQASASGTSASSLSRAKGSAGSAASRGKKARRYPPTIKLDESTSLQDLNGLLPPGCKFGYDAIDNYWRMSCYGTRYGRSIQLHGREGAALQLISLAWRRAMDEGWESSCPFPEVLS